MVMEPDDERSQAHLFTLRIWPLEGEKAVPQWRVRLQNVQSGDVNYCASWEALIACIEGTLSGQDDIPATVE